MDGSNFVGPLEPTLVSPAQRWRGSSRKLLAAVGGVVLLGAAGLYGRYYWDTGRFLVSTDDATVQADSVIVSPKI